MPKLELKDIIIKQLEEQKIEDIICADISKTSSLADYAIIGSGRSGKHIESSMENLKIFLKQKNNISGQINGNAASGWIVFDLGNIIIHLFEPQIRKIYKLEELFALRTKKAEKLLVTKEAKAKNSAKKTTGEKSEASKTKVKKPVAKKNIIKKISTKKPMAKKLTKGAPKKAIIKK